MADPSVGRDGSDGGAAGEAGAVSEASQASDATFLLFADARMPTGSHAHSGGLEQAAASARVRDPAELASFLRGRLTTVGLVDAALTAAARLFDPDGVEGSWDVLDAEAAARCPGPALREVARGHGRRLLRLTRSTWPADQLDRLADVTDGCPMWPVALGAAAGAAGIDGRRAAAVAAAAAVSGPAWAAVRALSLDPYVVAGLLAHLAPLIDQMADRGFEAARTRSWAELPAVGAPLLDIGAEEHRRWEVRLFAS